MATMKVQTEIEATPEKVVEHLFEFARSREAVEKIAAFEKAAAEVKFPAAAGELVYLTDGAAAAFGALANMPALVLSAPVGPPLGLVAFATEDNIQTARVMPMQIARKA